MKKSNFDEVSFFIYRTYSKRPFTNHCYVDVIFQQDSAPAHRAQETVALLSLETPDFIPTWLWPPNSPDLNPVDYHVWSVLEQRVYRTRIRDISHLKTRLVEEWQKFDQKIIDWAISQWRLRLRSCIQQERGYFEHRLWNSRQNCLSLTIDYLQC